ncbi:MAG: hypothetical protein ACM33V_13855 [Chloroflexota bacterium]
MFNFMRKHPYIVGYFITFLILFFIGIFALEDVSWAESLLGAAVLSAMGVGGIWWKYEGLG